MNPGGTWLRDLGEEEEPDEDGAGIMAEPWTDCDPLGPAAEFIDANMCAVLVVSRGERDEGSVEDMVTDPFSTRRSKSRKRFRPIEVGLSAYSLSMERWIEIHESAGEEWDEVLGVRLLVLNNDIGSAIGGQEPFIAAYRKDGSKQRHTR